MTHDVYFLVLILRVEGSDDVFHFVQALFELEGLVLHVPVVQHEHQMVSNSDLDVIFVPFFESVPHYGDQHVQQMDDHHEAGGVEYHVKLGLL